MLTGAVPGTRAHAKEYSQRIFSAGDEYAKTRETKVNFLAPYNLLDVHHSLNNTRNLYKRQNFVVRSRFPIQASHQ